MNPPPPMLPASGHVTARANAVATAASTALPPFRRTATPTSLAGRDTLTTMPSVPCAMGPAFGRSASAAGAMTGPATPSANRTNATNETRRLMIRSLAGAGGCSFLMVYHNGKLRCLPNHSESVRGCAMSTVEQRVPPLLPGQRLTRDEFLRRWEAMPELKLAELVGGIVYMPSPLSLEHG